MTCNGSSQLSVGMSVQPRWDSLPGVNRDKILSYLSSFLMNKFLARTNMIRNERVLVLVMFDQELELLEFDNHDSRLYQDLLMKRF